MMALAVLLHWVLLGRLARQGRAMEEGVEKAALMRQWAATAVTSMEQVQDSRGGGEGAWDGMGWDGGRFSKIAPNKKTALGARGD